MAMLNNQRVPFSLDSVWIPITPWDGPVDRCLADGWIHSLAEGISHEKKNFLISHRFMIFHEIYDYTPINITIN